MTVPTSAVDSIEEIELALSGEKSGTKVYSVQQGDTLSQIAENYGMTLEQVQGLNPHIDPARIHVGEEITLQNSEPLLSVKKTTTVEYTQAIAYESEVQYSDELYENESKIVTEGQNGVAQVVANVVSIDGVEQERTIQSWEVVQQPQNEVKVVGTKEKPTTSSRATSSSLSAVFSPLPMATAAVVSTLVWTGPEPRAARWWPLTAAL